MRRDRDYTKHRTQGELRHGDRMRSVVSRSSRARLSTAAAAASSRHAIVDIAAPADTANVTEAGNVLLVEKQLSFKPLQPKPAVRVDAAGLFAASDEPLAHTAADVGKYFQFAPHTVAGLFFHAGFCGPDSQRRQLKTAATMVRASGLALRDELLGLEREGRLGETAALIVDGARGVGKSSLLNYAAAACHDAGWLVVAVPSATDWTLGLGGRSCQAANQAYRCADGERFNDLPPALQPVEGARTVLVGGLPPRDEAVRAFLAGIEVERVEWVAGESAAADGSAAAEALVTLRSALDVAEALERDGEEAPPAAAGGGGGGGGFGAPCVSVSPQLRGAPEAEAALPWRHLYEQPDASMHLLLSTYLAHRAKLEQLPIKCAARAAHYAERAAAQHGGAPTLADILRPVATDEYKCFSDFPLPLRPVHDFLSELQTVDALPVLLLVDEWNRWDQMTSARAAIDPQSVAARSVADVAPLHARELLVPHMLHDARRYGGGMANGLMLCGITHDAATPPAVPRPLRKRWAQPHPWHRPAALPAELRAALRPVPPYSLPELQRTLDFYAHVGHLRDPALERQLADGRLAKKVHLMTAGVGADVYKLCEAM